MSGKAILIVTNNFPPIIDGVGDYCANLYEHLQQKGNEVFVVTRKNEAVCRWIEQQGITNFIKPVVTRWNMAGYLQVIRYVRMHKIKMVNFHYVPYSFSRKGMPLLLLPFYLLLRASGVRIITTFHEISVRLKGDGLPAFFLALVQRTIAFFLAFFSDVRITSVKLFAEYLRPFPVCLLPVPSNFERYSKNSIPKESFVVHVALFASRFYPSLLSAFQQVHYSGMPFSVWLLGRVDESKIATIQENILQYRLDSVVKVVEDISPETVCKKLAASDIYIQLETLNRQKKGGISDKSGWAALAQNMGLCIVTNAGDMTYDSCFNSSNTVFINDIDDAEEIAQKLKELINNPQKRNQYATEAKRTYTHKRSWNIIATHYEQYFTK